jgi:hypothetical protein
MKMINRHLLQSAHISNDDLESQIDESRHGQPIIHDEDDVPEEKLLEPSRITIKFENAIADAGLKTKLDLDVNVEPFEIKVGFREIEFFTQLAKSA